MTLEQAFIRALLTNEAALRAYEYACAVNLRYDPGQIQAALHRALRARGATEPAAEARPESARELVRRLTAEACAEVRAAIGDEWGSRPLREGIGEMRRRMIAAENAVAAYRAEQSSEPTVDEMAREMGLTRGVYRNWTTDSDADLVQLETDGQWVWRPSGTLRDHDLRSWPTDADAIRTLYREHKAKQRPPLTRFTCSRADCDDDQPHAHIESNLPIVDATKPPTDPSALAAWLYARVVPGRTVVERGGEYKAVVRSVARGRRCIILTGPDGEQVTAPGTLNLHLLNPDGTVLWEAK